MKIWDAIVAIVESFNQRGRSGFALIALAMFLLAIVGSGYIAGSGVRGAASSVAAIWK